MEEVLIPIAVFGSIALIVKIATDYSLRKQMIAKGLADDKSLQILSPASGAATSSLKWGMVLIGIGIAAFLSRLWPRHIDDEVTLGLMLIFAGVALLVYYGISLMKEKENKSDQINQ